jgi:hypothetical protein
MGVTGTAIKSRNGRLGSVQSERVGLQDMIKANIPYQMNLSNPKYGMKNYKI